MTNENDIATRLARRLFDRPLIQNSFRGAFVEELVSPLLAPFGWAHCGDDWGSWDFERTTGERLELKQSTAAQSWNESGKVRSPEFSIAEKRGFWAGGAFTEQPGRHAHIYVFAWHGVTDRVLADHRRLDQWSFFLLGARSLPTGQKRIRLSVLKQRGAVEVRSAQLGQTLEKMLGA
ncbi:MAG: hypothetical protein KF779_07235 [Hyphomonadaceae bacterium]|nr:hypothetical protein [Hyphomonadaceae bacterium]